MEKTYYNPIGLLPAYHQIEQFHVAAKKHNKYAGLKTGFSAIDEMTNGLEKLVLLGGEAGSGKTTLALQLALGVAKNEKIPVLFFSFEITATDLIVMAIQNLSDKTLCRKDLLKPRDEMTPIKLENYNAALRKFVAIANNFYIIDRSKINPTVVDIEKIILAVREIHQSENVFVVIDSFDDLLSSDKFKNRAEAQEETLGCLESLQQKTGDTILAITQKDRNMLHGSQQEGLRGDVSLYYKPAIILELINYKEILRALEDEGYVGLKIEKQKIEEIIAENNVPFPSLLYLSKHRYGVSSKIPLQFHGAFRSFEAGRVAQFSNPSKFRIYNYLDF